MAVRVRQAMGPLVLGFLVVAGLLAYAGNRAGKEGIGHDSLRGGSASQSASVIGIGRSPSRRLSTYYAEGEITNAEYQLPYHSSEAEVQAACSADAECLGYWQGYNSNANNFCTLISGSRDWSIGIPSNQVLSVQVKQATPTPTQATPEPTALATPTPTQAFALVNTGYMCLNFHWISRVSYLGLQAVSQNENLTK